MTEYSEIVCVEHSNPVRKGKGQEHTFLRRRESSSLPVCGWRSAVFLYIHTHSKVYCHAMVAHS